MVDIAQKTGRYLHGVDDVLHVEFPTPSVPRSFSVLRYDAIEQDGIHVGSGIAFIDNDANAVVLDGYLSGKEDEQARFMSDVYSMDWSSFMDIFKSDPRARVTYGDFQKPAPLAGSVENQVVRNVVFPKKDPSDHRTQAMIAANDDPACPYTFPKASKEEMIAFILFKIVTPDASGALRMSWPATVDFAKAPPSTVHAHLDQDVFFQAEIDINEPFLTSDYGTWPKSDAGRYDFRIENRGSDSRLFLKSIDGFDFRFSTKDEAQIILSSLSGYAIADIWKLANCLDHDMDYQRRHEAFKERVVSIRSQVDAIYEPPAEVLELRVG